MNRLTRRLLPLVLCAVIFVTGCSPAVDAPSGAEPGANRGRYMEQELSAPADLLSAYTFQQMEDGTLMLLGFQAEEYTGSAGAKGYYKIWSSGDGGESWREESFPWLEELLEAGMSVAAASFVSKDELYVFCTYYPEFAEDEDDEENETVIAQTPDEEAEKEYDPPSFHLYRGDRDRSELLSDAVNDNYDIVPSTMTYYDGSLMLNTYQSSKLLDLGSMTTPHTFPLHNDARFGNHYLDGDTFAVVQPSGIQLYSLSTGALEAELPYTSAQVDREGYSTTPDNLTAIAPLEGQEGIYYGNSTGIYRMLSDGSATERLLDGELCSLGLPTEYLLYLIPQQDGSFLALFTNAEYQFKLRRYVFDASVASVPEIEINLYSLEENATVRQAIGQFHSAYPQARINYQVGLSGDGAVSVSDALRSLSTLLLAGSGPDIIVLDGIPIDSYIEKGVLVDLSPLVDELLSTGELMENVADTFRDGSSLYAVPARFAVPMLQGDGVTGIGSLSQLADWMEGQDLGSGFPYNVAMERLYPVASGRWFGADGVFDSAAFAEDLASMKRLADPYEDMEGRAWSERDSLINGALSMKARKYAINFGYAYNLVDIAGPSTLMEELGAGDLVFFPDGGGCYIPSTILGINAQSDNTELAERFVRAVLSQENMANSFDDGLPVNIRALEETVEKKGGDHMGTWAYGFDDPDTGEYELYMLDVVVPSADELERFVGELARLDTPCHTSAIVRQLVIDETMAYFSDNKSLEDTVQAVSSKLDLYLAEMDAA